MAYTVTTTNLTFASTNSLVMTKPTGLAVNDLMIACYVSSGGTVTPPSGFTLYSSETSIFVYTKLADSADVAASDFTFSFSTTVQRVGGMVRVGGNLITDPLGQVVTGTATDTFAPTLAPTLTPDDEDSLLLIFSHAYSGTTVGVSSFSNVTTPPTYTIGWNVLDGAAEGFAMGYGMRNVATATGNFTASGGNGGSDWRAIAMSVNPYQIVISDTVTMTDSQLSNLSALASDNVTVSDSQSYSIGRIWRRATKPITTWIFRNKN